MAPTPFDTLKLAQSLRNRAHLSSEQAEGVANALAEAFQDRVATKDDLELLERRLTIKIGGMFAVAIGSLAAIEKLLH